MSTHVHIDRIVIDGVSLSPREAAAFKARLAASLEAQLTHSQPPEMSSSHPRESGNTQGVSADALSAQIAAVVAPSVDGKVRGA